MTPLDEGTVLLDSKSSRLPSAKVRFFTFMLGLFLLLHLSWTYWHGESKNSLFSQGIVGTACVLVSGWRRTLCLTNKGVLRKSSYWGRKHVELLLWKDVAYVALAFRKNEMMTMFDRGGLTGIKVLFEREQEDSLRKILKQYLPDSKIETIPSNS